METLKFCQDPNIEWLCLRDYADFLTENDHYSNALFEYEKSLMFVQELCFTEEEADLCYRIGQVNMMLGDDLEAINYFTHCLSILRDLPYTEACDQCIESLIKCHSRLRNFDELMKLAHEFSDRPLSPRKLRIELATIPLNEESNRLRKIKKLAKKHGFYQELGICYGHLAIGDKSVRPIFTYS
jgi:tetratricopeptide (TPR) repeat protein